MKLVIDIPEEVYKSIQDNDYCGISNSDMYNAINNGTPLPKGHGRLIDEKEAKYLISDGLNDKAYFGEVSADWAVIDFLGTVPTIIEADKEGDAE